MREVLHINWQPGLPAYWVHRVLGALQSCRGGVMRERLAAWGSEKRDGLTLGDLAIAVGTKLTMVPLVVRRADARLHRIGTLLQTDEAEVEACLREGAAYRVPDRDLAHEALIDFDAFLFETRSAYELTVEFLRRFFTQILRRTLQEDAARAALEGRGADLRWVGELATKRNLFIHKRAPWLVLEVKARRPFRFDPVLLTKNVERLEDDPERLSIEQCRSIWQGFVASYEHVEAWLKEEIAAADLAGG